MLLKGAENGLTFKPFQRTFLPFILGSAVAAFDACVDAFIGVGMFEVGICH